MKIVKNARCIVAITFAAMGGGYACLGGGMLLRAVSLAGSWSGIYALPEEQASEAVAATAFAGLGAAFLFAALILFLLERRARRQRAELMVYGTKLTGTVTSVCRDYRIRVNRKSPMIAQVHCVLPTGEKDLRSQPLWNVEPVPGQAVAVYCDPMTGKCEIVFEGE